MKYLENSHENLIFIEIEVRYLLTDLYTIIKMEQSKTVIWKHHLPIVQITEGGL